VIVPGRYLEATDDVDGALEEYIFVTRRPPNDSAVAHLIGGRPPLRA
jgi:hypothetical protein